MRWFRSMVIGLCASGLLVNITAWASDKGEFKTTPITKNGQKWRIGYYEGGPYKNYPIVLTAVINGLIDLGWLEPLTFPPLNTDDSKVLWDFLAATATSPYLEFVADAHYSPNWDENITKTMRQALITRLNTQHDIDLMIATGTTAGQSLANNEHQTPTIVISTNDPLGSGIIKSIEDSGYDHIHAQVDPQRFERQIRAFHQVINFKTLGVAYENSPNGYKYAAMDIIKKVAAEKDFEIITCYTKDEVPDVTVAEESVKACFRELTGKVESLYVTRQNGISNKNLPELVQLAIAGKLPTFSQAGSDEVRAGFLLSMAQSGLTHVGRFHAAAIAKVFNGAKPRQLEQLFAEPVELAVNVQTAKLIGVDLPPDLLEAANEVYTEILPAPGQ